DAVIVGSDQVWRPSMAQDPVAFFLGYVPEEVDRIAYAASFGTATWDFPVSGELTRNIRNELLQFKAISCREDSGVDICKSVFGVQASHVLDPLLLVEDAFLNNIISHSSVGKAARLVYYKLDASPAFER